MYKVSVHFTIKGKRKVEVFGNEWIPFKNHCRLLNSSLITVLGFEELFCSKLVG